VIGESEESNIKMRLDELRGIVVDALEELKAVDLKVIDLRGIAGFTDLMIIASGNSDRQVQALAGKVVEKCRMAGVRPLGVEGERGGDWILVDLGDIVLHVMRPETRDYYSLEKLWALEERRQDRTTARA
jgi:ribosome-associated protein